MERAANAERGEVDLQLDGQRFVLRPSYAAIVACEAKTAKSLVELATLAEQGFLSQAMQAIVTTELVRAWGRELTVDEYTSAADRALATAARGAGVEAMGELLFTAGSLAVQMRLAIVLGRAVTGGCLPTGEFKAATAIKPPPVDAA